MIDYRVEDRVARLTLNRPQAGNALSIAMMQEFRSMLAAVQRDPGVDLLLLRAQGRHFCTGADLQWVRAIVDGQREQWAQGMDLVFGLLDDLHGLDLPVVAAVQGGVIGAGVGLLCLCDLVIASESVRWRLPEVGLGMVPSAVMPALRARLAPAVVGRLVMAPEPWNSAQALAMGLAHQVVAEQALEDAVEAQLQSLRALPAQTLSDTKRLLFAMDADRFSQDLVLARPQGADTFDSQDARERLAAILK